MQNQPISDWAICIAGLMQRRHDTRQGIPASTKRLYQRHGGDVRVEFAGWDSNFDALAEWIFWSSQHGPPPRILIAAYSWGAGFGAVRLMRELEARGLRVAAAVFSDAVYHLGGRLCHRFGISQVAAYLPIWRGLRPAIALPYEPDVFYWYTQDNFSWRDRRTWLRGHEILVPAGDGQYRRASGCRRVRDVTHTYMDDLARFQQQVDQVAAETFSGRTAHVV